MIRILAIIAAIPLLGAWVSAQQRPLTDSAYPQWLVDQAAPNSIVRLPAGTFGALRITKPLHVVGDRGNTHFTGRVMLVQGAGDVSSLSWLTAYGGLVALGGDALVVNFCDIRGSVDRHGIATTVKALTVFGSAVIGGPATSLSPKAGIISEGRVSVPWGTVYGGLGMYHPDSLTTKLAVVEPPRDEIYRGGPGIVARVISPLGPSAFVRGGLGVAWDQRGTRSPRGPATVLQ